MQKLRKVLFLSKLLKIVCVWNTVEKGCRVSQNLQCLFGKSMNREEYLTEDRFWKNRSVERSLKEMS